VTTTRASRKSLDLVAARADLEKEFGEKGFRNGVSYVSEKRIHIESAQIDEERVWHLTAKVQGSDPDPYTTTVEMEFYKYGIDIYAAECSCAVHFNCKHAAGLAYLWTTRQPQKSGTLTLDSAEPVGDGDALPAASVADVRSAVAEPSAELVTHTSALPTPVKVWLEGIYSNIANDDDIAAANAAKETERFDSLIYFILPDGKLSAARAKRNKKSGELQPSGTLPSLSWANNATARPGYVSDDDEPILRLIAASIGPYRAEPTLDLIGSMGETILQMALASHRLWPSPEGYTPSARIASERIRDVAPLGDPFTLGPNVKGAIQWLHTPAQKNRPAMTMPRIIAGGVDETMQSCVIALTPPRLVNFAARTISAIEVETSAASLKKLLALPPIADDDASSWAFVAEAIDALPDADTIPPCPPIERLIERIAEPRPILKFALFEFAMPSGWGSGTIVFPGVQMLFAYPNRSPMPYDPRGWDAAIEEERGGGKLITQRLRNVRAEQRAEMRMPRALVPAIRVERQMSYLSGARFPIASLFALPQHDWARDGASVLADAQAAGFAIEIEAGFPISMEDIPEPTLELSPGNENGWFRLSLGVAVEGERIDLAPAFAKLIAAQKDPLLWLEKVEKQDQLLLSAVSAENAKKTFVVRMNGQRVAAILRPVFDWFQGGGVPQMSELQAALSPELPSDTVLYLGRNNPAWVGLRDKLAAGSALAPVTASARFLATLRSYQQHGLAWLAHMQSLAMGGVLADDMGLGKTIQTLAHLHREHIDGPAHKPSLIVAPKSVVSNWYAEAKRFAPDLVLHRHVGGDRSDDPRDLTRAHVVITSYPLVQRDEKLFGSIDWHTVVFDEAQTLKNPKAKTYRAAQSIRASMRLALTGTPMENHLGELWAIYNLLLPGLLGDLEGFNRVFRHPIEQRADAAQMAKLRARIRAFILRRTRDQVLTELPPKTETTRWIEFDDAQADLYESLRTAIHDDIRKVIDKKGLKQSTIHILDALLKLRQVCCDPRLVRLPGGATLNPNVRSSKLDWLAEHVPTLLEEGRRILIFSQFTSMLALISEVLNDSKIAHVILTGETHDRDTPIARFQSGDVSVFLLSLKAGGVGLNLTAADAVIHYDPWWNPAVEAQATARAYRMGQDKPVFVTKLVARGTLEERMLAMLERKRELAGALLDGQGNALTGLTLADVDALLAPISSLASPN
jgi:superfamily II DNA or RNA helicase